MNVQIPFYLTGENTDNSWFHVSQQGEGMDWDSKLEPPHLSLQVHSKSCLSSTPASRACNALVFLRSQTQLAAVGFYEPLQSTSLSSRLRTLKPSIFVLSSRNVSSVLCQKSIHKSWQSRNSPALLCQCCGHVEGTILSLKLCFGCLDTSTT